MLKYFYSSFLFCSDVLGGCHHFHQNHQCLKGLCNRHLLMLLNCAGEDLRIPWTARRKPVNPKGNQPWIFLGRTVAEAPTLWPPDAKSWVTGKGSKAGKDWRWKEKGVAEDEMVREHHWLNGHEFEQTPGESRAQSSLGRLLATKVQRVGHG